MADKEQRRRPPPALLYLQVSTIVLTVDLECSCCYSKVKKTLCKYRERYQIQEEIFDKKQNTVTLSGPFCPKMLAKKLCCKAGDAIKCFKIIDKKPPCVSVVPPIKVVPPTPPPCLKQPPTKPVKPPPVVIVVVSMPICPPVSTPVVETTTKSGPCYEGNEGGPCHQGYGGPPRCYDEYGRPPSPCNCESGRPPPPCNCGCGRLPPPCNCGCGRPPPSCNCGCGRLPPPCNCGCGRPPPSCNCGCERSTYMSPCCKYFSEEDRSSCIIM